MQNDLRAPRLERGITKRADVVSDINLNSFLHWCREVKEDKLRRTLEKVSIRVHLSSTDGLVADPPLRVRDLAVRQKPCNRPQCDRCDTKKGGYYFNYCAKQWTPLLSLVSPKGLPASPDQARFLCSQLSWPAGLRRDGLETAAIVKQLDEALAKWEAQVVIRGLTWSGRQPGLDKKERADIRREQFLKDANSALAYATGVCGSVQVHAVGLAGTFGVADDFAATSSKDVHIQIVSSSPCSLEMIGRKGVIAHTCINTSKATAA